jgi:hypothetical protein
MRKKSFYDTDRTQQIRRRKQYASSSQHSPWERIHSKIQTEHSKLGVTSSLNIYHEKEFILWHRQNTANQASQEHTYIKCKW